MSLRKHESNTLPTAERLAKALRSGLDLRWSIPSLCSEADTSFPPSGNARPFLEPYADSLHYPLPRHRNPLLRLVQAVRQVLRRLISPWLDMQTHFNLSTVNVLEQVEQRVQSLAEAEFALRQSIETLEKMFLSRADGELGKQVKTLEEGFRLRVNRELSQQGKLAQAGLWFKPPVLVQWEENGPRVAGVTERILEHIFIHTHLPHPPARLLDLGCGESTSAIEMASLGFQVVGVDSRNLPLSHPNFTMLQTNRAELPFDDESFDGAVALSMREPAVGEVFRVLKHGGRFLVTTPFGRRAVAPHRIYDRAELDRLLGDFRVIERSYGIRDGETWSCTLDERRAEQVDGMERVGAVCLLVLEKP
jgi:SAM-dependent methyltransferase